MSIGRKPRGGLAKRQSQSFGRQRTSDRIRQTQQTSVSSYSSNWSAIREAVLIRDNYTCKCGARCLPGEVTDVILTVDHKIPRSRGGQDVMHNLITLCIECHSRKPGKANKRGGKLLEGSAKRIREQRNVRRLQNKGT